MNENSAVSAQPDSAIQDGGCNRNMNLLYAYSEWFTFYSYHPFWREHICRIDSTIPQEECPVIKVFTLNN